MQLNTRTVRELQYFIGKICTIVTKHDLPVDHAKFAEFFVGRVDSISEECIWTTHLVSGMKSVFFDIVSLNEEQIIDEDQPAYQEIEAGNFDSIAGLTQHAQALKSKLS